MIILKIRMNYHISYTSFEGKHALVTAGPTIEVIDPKVCI